MRAAIFFFYVILMLMPYQVTLVPNYLVSKWLHILDTRWAIILPGVSAPFSPCSCSPSSCGGYPIRSSRPPRSTGGRVVVFTRVCMPQCRAALYSIAILVFIDYWNMVE